MCVFKKISKNELKKSLSYIIATTILNQSHEFTIENILTDVEKKITKVQPVNDVNIESLIITKLKMLRDNGLVIEHGSYFTLR